MKQILCVYVCVCVNLIVGYTKGIEVGEDCRCVCGGGRLSVCVGGGEDCRCVWGGEDCRCVWGGRGLSVCVCVCGGGGGYQYALWSERGE